MSKMEWVDIIKALFFVGLMLKATDLFFDVIIIALWKILKKINKLTNHK